MKIEDGARMRLPELRQPVEWTVPLNCYLVVFVALPAWL